MPSNLGDTHGNIAAEAIQFGCALILSNMVGLSPECEKNKIGLVFDINNKEDLIKKLELITNNKNLLDEFRSNALIYGSTKKPAHAANLITEILKKKMNFELIDGANIVASTNKNFDHSVGYHDIKPFNAENENLILLHRYPEGFN